MELNDFRRLPPASKRKHLIEVIIDEGGDTTKALRDLDIPYKTFQRWMKMEVFKDM